MEKDKGVNIHKDHRKRLKGQFMSCMGAGMSDVTFLEYVLFFSVAQKDTNPIAHRLLDTFGSFDKVLEANVLDLQKVDGVGEHTAIFLSSLLPIYERYSERKAGSSFSYDDIDKMKLFIRSKYINQDNEVAIMLFFDSKGNYTNYTVLNRGDLSSVKVDNRTIAAEALRNDSTGVVLVHNHPSGSAVPSFDDLVAVKNFSEFLKTIDIDLLDNAIVTSNKILFFSQQPKYMDYLL